MTRAVRPPSLEDVAREFARPAGALCVCCGGSGARPAPDLGELLCPRCGEAWTSSAERARAAMARTDFIERRRREIGGGR